MKLRTNFIVLTNQYTFHNYPRLNEDLTAQEDPEGGITKVGSGSRLSLSFGGIDPETREIQNYWAFSTSHRHS